MKHVLDLGVALQRLGCSLEVPMFAYGDRPSVAALSERYVILRCWTAPEYHRVGKYAAWMEAGIIHPNVSMPRNAIVRPWVALCVSVYADVSSHDRELTILATHPEEERASILLHKLVVRAAQLGHPVANVNLDHDPRWNPLPSEVE